MFITNIHTKGHHHIFSMKQWNWMLQGTEQKEWQANIGISDISSIKVTFNIRLGAGIRSHPVEKFTRSKYN